MAVDGHAGIFLDDCGKRLDLQVPYVAESEDLVGEVVLLDPVKVPGVDVLHAELRQGQDDARAGSAAPHNIDASRAEGVGLEDAQVPKRINRHSRPPLRRLETAWQDLPSRHTGGCP